MSSKLLRIALLATVAAGTPALTQCTAQKPPPGPAPRSPAPESLKGVLRVDTVARGLEHPWGVAVLPDGRLLVTERSGRVRIVEQDGRLSKPLGGVPKVLAEGHGGLLDIALDPRFSDNPLVYLSYAEPGEDGLAGTAVARGRLGASGLENVRVIYRQQPKVKGSNHFGSRLVFARDGALFVTQGDRFDYRDQAQNLASGLGKIVRINSDGSVPRDNPFAGQTDARPEIWSYGHRNVQAAALHPETGQLWTVEHGARGGDELNHPEAGKNYGWPIITYGIDYSGAKIGEGSVKPGLEQPVYYWDPVIAPSGMVFYTGDAFPDWKGSVLIGSMQPGRLVRLTLQDGKVAREERYLGGLGKRIRDVQQGLKGELYLLTDEDEGQVLRVTPAAP
ncbi:MAG: PQQ-dependent sugar dehydrogenase [Gemmatimonadales bacterium]|nr:PQQ-dependent sugar dehydrogenase [Gemmatimonadales bacterium]